MQRRGGTSQLERLGRARFGNERGNVALTFAVALPCLLLLGGGALELTLVNADQKRTQQVADSAALMGAAQLTSASSGVLARAQAFALAQLGDVGARASVNVVATQPTPSQVQVTVTTNRTSFFGNLLPAGGFNTSATSVATATSTAPLCVLGIAASTSNDDVHTASSSVLNAGACLVHANRNLQADGGTSMQAGAAEASGSAAGSISPSANIGAAPIKDPFETLALTPPANCNTETTSASNGQTLVLQPGLHCSTVDIADKGAVTLAPGVHWFQAGVSLGNKGTLDGTQGATLVFMNGAGFTMEGASSMKSVNLVGSKTGPLAGFVLITTRDYTADFDLPADAINVLTGAVYDPSGRLVVDGSTPTNQASPWSVVVAKGVEVTGGADLFINSNYSASDVPVPAGVGPTAGGARLSQ